MTCDEVRARLDEYFDETLADDERKVVAIHLKSCAGCRAELAALEALLADAAGLPKSILPERDLWEEIEQRLGERGTGRPGGGSNVRPWDRGTGWWLAAAAVLLMALSSLATAAWMRRGASLAAVAIAGPAEYARATADLIRQVQAEERSLSPATLAVIQRNLAIVDAAIRESEDAVARDPGNHGLQQMVLSCYEQRLNLLRQAVRAVRES
jgi:anti-sigma factor RsiW